MTNLSPATMMAFPPPTKSPKRKRDATDSQYDRPSISSSPPPSIPKLQENFILDDEDLGRNSPRTAVAGYFGDLDIYEGSARPERPLRVIVQDGKMPTHTQMGGGSDICASTSSDMDVDSLANGCSAPDSHEGETALHSPVHKKGKTSTSSESSPRAKNSSALRKAPRPRVKSPPLGSDSEENPLTWNNSEITGHLATDPNDDGYGINGIGFKPTAAIAWARSERRKKQVAEWKNREAREARQSRRERRDGVVEESNPDPNPSHKKVKFDA